MKEQMKKLQILKGIGEAMNRFLRGSLLPVLSGIALIIVLAGCGGGGSDYNYLLGDLAPTPAPSEPAPVDSAPSAVVQPLEAGPYAVACSNVVQDFTLVGLIEEEEVTNYWEGLPSGDRTRYVTDLLADPANTLIATVNAPSDPDLYGDFVGQEIKFAVIVCYPTTADNPRDDYPLWSTDRSVPHMQTGSQAPLFADASVRYPVVAFSHGYKGSPISSDDYMRALTVSASYGYIVIAPFHGDLRFANLSLDDLQLQDLIDYELMTKNFTAMQALRPLAISAALDLVLSHPQWKDHIDETKIGGFGASMGGQTMLLLAGAKLTTTYFDIVPSARQVTYDPRIKAAVGYVPYFGHPILPAFGNNQEGLDGISLPFLGLSGTADTTAPISEAEKGISRLTGTRRLVALTGVVHEFDDAFTNDIFTWTVTFLDAQVKGDPAAISRLSTMGSVAGGGDDNVWLY
ncbi:MAG: alpha/beta hydrolase family protein [Smithellaceae bacterium]